MGQVVPLQITTNELLKGRCFPCSGMAITIVLLLQSFHAVHFFQDDDEQRQGIL